MLGLTARSSSTSSIRTSARVAESPLHRRPALGHRAATNPPANWPRPDTATHYFDASSHSALTLRTVLNAHQQSGEVPGQSDEQLMMSAVSTLVAATCPQGDMDSETHAYFSMLLNMHLSGLEPEELKSLARALKASGYDKISADTARQHDIYDDAGFVSDQPQQVAILPSDWHHLLDDAIEHAAAIARRPLVGKPPGHAEARAARQCLRDAALQWPVGEQSMTDIVTIARQLADALGVSPAPRVGCSAKSMQRGSLLDWKDDVLIIGVATFRALTVDANGQLFGEVLRDLLELLLARRMFGDSAHPSRLCASDRTRLNKAVSEVLAADPGAPAAPLRQAAARVLARSGEMGKVQILPTVGVALGHASIGSSLSVMPDTSKPAVNIGTRYMHPGFRLEPDDCQVMQWPIRWLDANAHAKLFNDERAWQIIVPVDGARLQKAATDVAAEWKARETAYRFTGTAPGMPSTGCRASVWQAIARGMDPDARTLFAYFNAGLPEPESPTELATRMNHFMRWLPTISDSATKPTL